MIAVILISVCALASGVNCVSVVTVTPDTLNSKDPFLCDLLAYEIRSYDKVVRQIVNYVLDGPYTNKTYNDLAEFVDEFGQRLSGSESLERSIDYVVNKSQHYGLDVYTEDVKAPHWVRGEESAAMISPRYQPLQLLGLGYSVATPPEGLTAEAIVVQSFEELERLPSTQVAGKIVVYNQRYTTYGETVRYRSRGATTASLKGAVGALVRTIAPFSIGSPHTGMQRYGNNTKPIPVACISIEDANLLHRIYKRGKKIAINLKMNSSFGEATSRNVLIDVKGIDAPEKIVIVSGHIDSWDVGQGAMDDGGGAFISWAVPIILKNLDLKPKRTLRAVLWTAEELGLVGAFSYAERHKEELDNINFVLESDEGTFAPTGLEVSGNDQVQCIIGEVLKLFEFMNASRIEKTDGPGSDIVVLTDLGIPGGGMLNENERYFWFHHSNGDSMDVLNPRDLDMATAFWTAVSYVIADLSADLPRGPLNNISLID